MNVTAPPGTEPLLPPGIGPGATLGLFSPAGPVRDPGPVQAGIARLREMGYRVRIGPLLERQLRSPLPPDRYLAASDRERARELMDLWRDPAVHGLMAVRGGYGCQRLIGRLDFTLFRQHIKPLVGFSDLTVLLGALRQYSGLVTIHGPVLTALARSDAPSLRSLARALAGQWPPRDWRGRARILRPGRARGPLAGGNLTCLVHTLATAAEQDLKGVLLVLEDTGESLYRLDRLLTHLAGSGRLGLINGLLLGRFDPGQDRPGADELMCGVEQRVLELIEEHDLHIPVWSRIPVGHGRENHALPHGWPAVMNDGVLVPVESEQQHVEG